MIRITAGKFKGKQLNTISEFVRPTSSIKREAFFSIVESFGLKKTYNYFNNKIFLDLFAGIGSMGLEAVSRGIKSVIFYEDNEKVIEVLKENCFKICQNEQYKIINQNLESLNIDLNFENISIIYIDPPYNKYDINKLLIFLQNKITKFTIIGVENSVTQNIVTPDKLKLIKQKKYGKANLSCFVLT